MGPALTGTRFHGGPGKIANYNDAKYDNNLEKCMEKCQHQNNCAFIVHMGDAHCTTFSEEPSHCASASGSGNGTAYVVRRPSSGLGYTCTSSSFEWSTILNSNAYGPILHGPFKGVSSGLSISTPAGGQRCYCP